MKYYPPRPEKAVDPSELNRYPNLGWIAQFKKNGTYTVLDQGTVYTRHLDEHLMWDPKSSVAVKEIQRISGVCLCSELLNNKVKDGHRDTLYIHDILVYKGEDLVGETYEDRYTILMSLFDVKDEGDPSHWVVSKNIWISKCITSGFKGVFDSITSPEDEGLVLKNPKARLKVCNKPSTNSGWQIKCRKSHKNYSF